MSAWSGARRAVRAALLGIAAFVVLVEEWGSRPLARAAAWIARWPPLAHLEALIRRSGPRAALALFLGPALLLFPLKLAALALIGAGHVALGVGVIVAAKLVGTAFVGRLFVLLEPQLMQFAWFARALAWWQSVKARLVGAIHRSAAWRAARRVRRRVGAWLLRLPRGMR
ncbi:hypothetical protein [Piscinibacter koreensis]|uniref:Transmembrane protein n=1 Tax=Piscinibacter koreensis TaxID=2742824 RepID=A0A7Y6TUY4_9BURK|nr:hypothetical protein [Schlegelella koreensis]NUZ04490.1 hypothetical protein [Schlegelella koreensis]